METSSKKGASKSSAAESKRKESSRAHGENRERKHSVEQRVRERKKQPSLLSYFCSAARFTD
jgi:demethoxyubiquinone hydroxylase (CLK1/Coq7/Cat5 family)